MGDNQIIKGVVKGLGQLGVEMLEKAKEESGKIAESIITGKELLGLERTMSDSELAFKKQEEEKKSREEVEKLRKEMGSGRKVEEEITQLRKQEEREEEEKEKYYQQAKEQRELQEQQAEYNGLAMESSNPAKQKKSRGSAFVHKKKQQPDQSQMSQTQEFKGKID